MYLRVTRGRSDPADLDAVLALVPAVAAAIRALPGCESARVGLDRATGASISVAAFDTAAHARFAREDLGEPMARLQALGWRGEDPDIYEEMT